MGTSQKVGCAGELLTRKLYENGRSYNDRTVKKIIPFCGRISDTIEKGAIWVSCNNIASKKRVNKKVTTVAIK